MHPIYTPTEQELNLIQGFNFEELKTLSPQENGREKWLKQRQGKFTASNIHKLLTCENKIELPKGAMSYIEEVAIEILTDGQSREDFTSQAMQHGQQTELKAIARFEKETGFLCYNTGEEQEFIQCNELFAGKFGGTPDGLFAPSGLIEIKCPNPKTHFFNLQNLKSAEDLKKHYPAYYWQIQANLFIAARTKGFFISFDDRFTDKNLQIKIVKVPFNQKAVAFMLLRLKQAVVYLEKLINRQTPPEPSM